MIQVYYMNYEKNIQSTTVMQKMFIMPFLWQVYLW